MKLNNFRTKSYNIRILVNEKEVFKGFTPRNLGYCHLSFPATMGKKIKIELIDVAAQETSGVEVNGKKLDDGVTRDDANTKKRLSIIEAEIYETL